MRASGRVVADLPLRQRPRTLTDAYAIQQRVVDALLTQADGQCIGFKVACTNEIAQAALQIDRPGCGRGDARRRPARRRIEQTKALLVVTYRKDQLGRGDRCGCCWARLPPAAALRRRIARPSRVVAHARAVDCGLPPRGGCQGGRSPAGMTSPTPPRSAYLFPIGAGATVAPISTWRCGSSHGWLLAPPSGSPQSTETRVPGSACSGSTTASESIARSFQLTPV